MDLKHLLFSVICISAVCGGLSVPVVKLGALFPFPSTDSSVPPRLATEWITALRVALDVLSLKYADYFEVKLTMQNSNCDKDAARKAAQNLIDAQVVGVIGPACSEAAVGAAEVLGPAGIPLISFAATADELRDKSLYPTFFRTVFNDTRQSLAFKSTVKAFKWKKVYIFYSDETYGKGLQKDIVADLRNRKLDFVKSKAVKFNLTTEDYEILFKELIGTDTVSNETVIIFNVLPLMAEGIWLAASNLGHLKYPYWYLGSDATTALDFVGEGDGGNLQNLTNSLQGELGLSPFKGDYTAGSHFNEFLSYWEKQTYNEYPGLLTYNSTPKFSHTRAYVPYLIDAAWTFFDVFKNIASRNENITAASVFSRLRLKASWRGFDGCTGHVVFDKFGERTIEDEHFNGPVYNLDNFVKVTWEAKATWTKKNYSDSFHVRSLVTRPGPVPEGSPYAEAPPYDVPPNFFVDLPSVDYNFSNYSPNSSTSPAGESEHKKHGGTGAGVVVGIIVVLLVAGAAIGIGIWYYLKRRHDAKYGTQFVRML